MFEGDDANLNYSPAIIYKRDADGDIGGSTNHVETGLDNKRAQGVKLLVRRVGIEPTTYGLRVHCSAN